MSTLRTRRLAVCALLLCLMLILGYVETLIPVAPSIPGIKLGLSNSVLVLALYALGIPSAIALMVMKVALSGFLFSGVSAMAYAFAGGCFSLLAMAPLSRLKGLNPIVVSAVGGLCHNVGQVSLAMLILQTPGLVFYMAVLMAVGLATGGVTGFVSALIMKRVPKTGAALSGHTAGRRSR